MVTQVGWDSFWIKNSVRVSFQFTILKNPLTLKFPKNFPSAKRAWRKPWNFTNPHSSSLSLNSDGCGLITALRFHLWPKISFFIQTTKIMEQFIWRNNIHNLKSMKWFSFEFFLFRFATVSYISLMKVFFPCSSLIWCDGKARSRLILIFHSRIYHREGRWMKCSKNAKTKTSRQIVMLW